MIFKHTNNSLTRTVVRDYYSNSMVLLQDCGYKSTFASLTHHGVLSLEHTGGRNSIEDGFKLCLLAEVKESLAARELKDQWMLLENQALVGMIKKVMNQGLCPPHK